jgi:hypothetical protein
VTAAVEGFEFPAFSVQVVTAGEGQLLLFIYLPYCRTRQDAGHKKIG